MTPSTVMADSISDDDDDSFTKPLGRRSVTYYGTGHMLNDITAACWFTYLLLFLTDIGLSPRAAASVMLSGQIADAFATIFTGELRITEIAGVVLSFDPKLIQGDWNEAGAHTNYRNLMIIAKHVD